MATDIKASKAQGASPGATQVAGEVAGNRPQISAQQAAALSGAVKAALWLLSADEDTAVGTLQLLSHDEVRRIRQVAETLQKVSPDELARVHSEFKFILEQQPLRLRGSVQYLGRLAGRAYGESAATQLMANPGEAIPAALILGTSDPQLLAMNLREEHPQVIAAVLASLAPSKASSLLNQLSVTLRDEVLMRMAQLRKIPKEAVERAQAFLRDTLPTIVHDENNVDGVRLTAIVLNEAGVDEAERALKSVGTTQGELASLIRGAMFTFEDLERLDKRGVQTLLKDVPSDRLALALRTATDSFKEKIFGGMSMRAAEMMREDMEATGPTKVSEVEAAKKDIVSIATKLRDEGKISLGGAIKGDTV